MNTLYFICFVGWGVVVCAGGYQLLKRWMK
jgi:hypothetical protein